MASVSNVAPTRVVATSIGLMVVSCALTACKPSKELEGSRAAYAVACYGTPLRTNEARNQAREDGYDINRDFDCISKASYQAVTEAQGKWNAANTPEAKAQRAAEREKMVAEAKVKGAEEAEREATARLTAVPLPPLVLRPVDVNTASEAELAAVVSMSSDVAAKIVAERAKRRFNDWADLVNRVVGVSQAQTAVYASVCGLNVNGQSLDGAPPDGLKAAFIKQKYQKN
jgi:DNA uptake protein ComE-like DNA-binding protein